MRSRRLPLPLAAVLALTTPLAGCAGVAAGPPPPMSTTTAESLVLADVATAELGTDAALLEVAHLVPARKRAGGASGGEPSSLATLRPLLAAWGWRGALPASCASVREDGALVLDCEAQGAGPTRRIEGALLLAAASGTTTLKAEGLVLATSWPDGRARTRRFDGTTSMTREADGTVRIVRDLSARTELVREYGTVSAERIARSELTYTPDARDGTARPTERGRVSVTRTVTIRLVAPDAVRDRTTDQTTEVPLHWDRACFAKAAASASSRGFDEGTLVFRTEGAGAEVRVLRLVFAGCGPGAATLDGAAASLSEAGDLDADPDAESGDVSGGSTTTDAPSEPVQSIDSD